MRPLRAMGAEMSNSWQRTKDRGQRTEREVERARIQTLDVTAFD